MVSLALAISAGNHTEDSCGWRQVLSIVYYVGTAGQLSHGVTAHSTHGTKDWIGFRTSLDSGTKWTILTPAGYIESWVPCHPVRSVVTVLTNLRQEIKGDIKMVSMHFMKAYRRSVCITVLILNFRPRRRCEVICTPNLFPRERGPGVQWIWSCFGPRDVLDFEWIEKYLVCGGNGTKIPRFSSS